MTVGICVLNLRSRGLSARSAITAPYPASLPDLTTKRADSLPALGATGRARKLVMIPMPRAESPRPSLGQPHYRFILLHPAVTALRHLPEHHAKQAPGHPWPRQRTRLGYHWVRQQATTQQQHRRSDFNAKIDGGMLDSLPCDGCATNVWTAGLLDSDGLAPQPAARFRKSHRHSVTRSLSSPVCTQFDWTGRKHLSFIR